MGDIGKVDKAENTEIAGAKVKTIYVKAGGGIALTGDNYGHPGIDSMPLETDYAVLVPVPGGYVAVGFADPLNAGEAAAGETKINGRDSSGAIVGYVHLKSSGQVDINGNFTVDPIP